MARCQSEEWGVYCWQGGRCLMLALDGECRLPACASTRLGVSQQQAHC
jgi:hypothetical protein